MRPVRSLQIPPEVGKSPTDFTDIHRYLLGRFLSHADFADDADFFSWDFYSSDFTEFIRRLTAETITHGFSQMRPVRSLQIPPETGKSPTDFTDIHRYLLGRFLSHADFADDADFFSWDFFSSDATEFIRRLTAETITHGFSQMRPVRSLQIPPESGKCPTDFTDLHRFFLGCFFVTQISQMTQIFFLMGFFFIGFHGNYSEVDCWDDYSRIFADATCPVVADTPETGKSPTDFTDLHRFFHRSFLSHRFHRFTQIFLGTFF